MSAQELALADYLDWTEIAAAWGEAYERTHSATAKAHHRIAQSRAEAARTRITQP